MKYKWKVSDIPTGRYRAFEKRAWPCAYYENGEPCAWINCEDAYAPKKVKTGQHKELTLRVADHSEINWKWRVFKQRFKTLQEAKDALDEFLIKNPSFMPKGE